MSLLIEDDPGSDGNDRRSWRAGRKARARGRVAEPAREPGWWADSDEQQPEAPDAYYQPADDYYQAMEPYQPAGNQRYAPPPQGYSGGDQAYYGWPEEHAEYYQNVTQGAAQEADFGAGSFDDTEDWTVGHGKDGWRRLASGPQLLAGVVLAGAAVLGVMVYVPSILSADSHSFAGVVSSSGVASLNFAQTGRLGTVMVQLGQTVKAGTLLASETGAADAATLNSDNAAVTDDETRLTALQAAGQISTPAVAAVQALLAKDKARLASDTEKLQATEILAPQTGTVVAIFGQPGETVSAAGIRDLTSQSQAALVHQPRFSLFPFGPMSNVKNGSAGQSLPVIELRTSGGWQVSLLIPVNSTTSVTVGRSVTISVPGTAIKGVPGVVRELASTPVTTTSGTAFPVIVEIRGHTQLVPLNGMPANVQLSP